MMLCKLWLPVIVLLSLLGCKPSGEQIFEKVGASLSKGKPAATQYIAVVYYDPLNCLGCNSLLSSIFNDTYKPLWGSNAYIVFGGIRENEVKDYQKNLEDMGSIFINIVNDENTYTTIQELTNVQYKGKPLVLLVSKNKIKPLFVHDNPHYLDTLNVLLSGLKR